MSKNSSNVYSNQELEDDFGSADGLDNYEYEYADPETSLDDSTDSELNFIHGDETSEELDGTSKDDGIFGYAGDDDLFGYAGDDVLIGVDFTDFGAGEIDLLTGGTGEDIFSLGTEEQAFYIEEGIDDFAIISDYSLEEGDIIIAYGAAEDYELVPIEDEDSVAIFYQEEAIGYVEDYPDLDLSTDFIFWDEISDV